MLKILDCNNFWSPTGGGVRRYHLEKMNYLAGRTDVQSVVVLQAAGDSTERRASNVIIEYLRAPKLPGGDYRLLFRVGSLRRVILKYRPDVIEVGSPYVMPLTVRLALHGTLCNPARVGFWHADFPRTDVGRWFQTVHPRLQRPAENTAWWWARLQFGRMDAVFVASRRVGQNMARHGLARLYHIPLAVDAEKFNPRHRDVQMTDQLKAGIPERPVIFFPHRFVREKGVRTILEAYPILCAELPHEPALVFAGDGPLQRLVVQAAERYRHVHYLGYIQSEELLARWYASCDMALALCAFETFGLSTAEAMASGLTLVGADAGAAAELIEESGCGLTVPCENAEALARAIVTLARQRRFKERGELARNYIKKFTWQSTFDRQLACYRDVLKYKALGQPVPKGFHRVAA